MCGRTKCGGRFLEELIDIEKDLCWWRCFGSKKVARAEAQKAKGEKGKGGNNEQGKGRGIGKGQTQSDWKKFDGHYRHCDTHVHMDRDCWRKNTDKFKNVHELSKVDPTQLRLSFLPSLPSVPSVAPIQLEALCVAEEVPREPWIFPLDCEHDSERRDVEVNHLKRTDEYIVIDSGAAVSETPRAFAATLPIEARRQSTLRLAPGYIGAFHGHRAVPLQLRGGEIVHSPPVIADIGRPLMSGREFIDRVKERDVHNSETLTS